MTQFFLFIFGAIIGSFLNVVILRYDPDKFLFSPAVIGGRSHCPKCGHKLNWFELIPLLSFILQSGKCRNCRAPIRWHYPLVELTSGLIFVLVPGVVTSPYLSPAFFAASAALWVLVFLTLLVVAAIDLRLNIIPDEANIFLVLLGIMLAVLSARDFGPAEGSFLGGYALLFGLRESLVLNRIFATGLALAFFGLIVGLTRGRGMGLGDVKLALALALVFGWPDGLILTLLAFILGSVFGGGALLLRKKKMGSFLPFGPFLALGSALTFFMGRAILAGYFGLLGS